MATTTVIYEIHASPPGLMFTGDECVLLGDLCVRPIEYVIRHDDGRVEHVEPR